MSQNTAPDKGIEVAIIDDQRDLREGIAFLINGTAGFRCTQLYGSMEEALADLPRHPPTVALIDIGLPGMSGIEGVRRLKQSLPGTISLMLTIYGDDERIFDAICAGACGYLLKNTPPARLLESIREAAEGGSPMSPEVARRVLELFHRFHPPTGSAYHLTPQEKHLLRLLVEGHQHKTAAAELGLSIHTVGFHMRNIYEKLHVHSKSEAVAKALREGLIL